MEESTAPPLEDIVDECPPPPSYYKHFTTPTYLSPPVLSETAQETSWSAAKQYNGAVTLQLVQQQQLDQGPPKDGFKMEMKSILRQILTDGVDIVSSDDTRSPRNTEQTLQPLRLSIDRMNAIITSYQAHEAREILCQDLARQIQRLRAMKEQLTRLNAECEAIVKKS